MSTRDRSPLGPLFLVTEMFGPANGATWDRYIAWSRLHQLTELVTVDTSLCGNVVAEVLDADWGHVVEENSLLHLFTDLDYLLLRSGGAAGKNLLCVFRNPATHPVPPPGTHRFRFEGYDLLDLECGPSALTNCGGFPRAFRNEELTHHGLLQSLKRARQVQRALRHQYPDEEHAQCDVWAVYRATTTAPGDASPRT